MRITDAEILLELKLQELEVVEQPSRGGETSEVQEEIDSLVAKLRDLSESLITEETYTRLEAQREQLLAEGHLQNGDQVRMIDQYLKEKLIAPAFRHRCKIVYFSSSVFVRDLATNHTSWWCLLGKKDEKPEGRVTKAHVDSPAGKALYLARLNNVIEYTSVSGKFHRRKILQITYPQDARVIEDIIRDTVRPDHIEIIQLAPNNRNLRPHQTIPVPVGGSAVAADSSNDEPALVGKPMLVAHKHNRKRIIAVVAVPADANRSKITVFQNDEQLALSEHDPHTYLLSDVTTDVRISISNQERVITLSLENEPYLLFSLAENDNTRHCHLPGRGQYLFICPDHWQRDEQICGRASITPEGTNINGYLAHYFAFNSAQEAIIGFNRPQEDPFRLTAFRIQLVGQQFEVSDDRNTKVFYGRPPSIRLEPNDWSCVSRILVGPCDAPRQHLALRPDSTIHEGQELPERAFDRHRYSYTICLQSHDQGSDIGSLDFVYFKDLDSFEISAGDPLPRNGHSKAIITLRHSADLMIKPRSCDTSNITMVCAPEETIITMPPDPESDEASWEMSSQTGPKFTVTIRAHRIWWKLGNQAEEQKWEDMPLKLSQSDLAANSPAAIWLRMPGKKWAAQVCISLGLRLQKYSVPVDSRTVIIPLKSFADSDQRVLAGNHEFMISLRRGHDEHKAVIAILENPAECIWCNQSVSNVKQQLDHVCMQHLEEVFKQASLGELQQAYPELELPDCVYGCPNCSFFAAADKENATGIIYDHLKEEHPGILHSFRIVNNHEELGRILARTIPNLFFCKICDDAIEEETASSTDKRCSHLQEGCINRTFVQR